MIKINILAVGNLKEKFWTEAVSEYEKRISRYARFKITELPEKRTKEEEGKDILRKITGYPVAMDIAGKEVSSTEFADFFDKKLTDGISEFSLIIGGSDGLSDEVKSACKERISFGRVTFPHQLMRVILSEQVYRALTIMNNVTYHK